MEILNLTVTCIVKLAVAYWLYKSARTGRPIAVMNYSERVVYGDNNTLGEKAL